MRCSELFDRTFIREYFSILANLHQSWILYDMITIDSSTVTYKYDICIVVFTTPLDLRDQSKCQPRYPPIPDSSDTG